MTRVLLEAMVDAVAPVKGRVGGLVGPAGGR